MPRKRRLRNPNPVRPRKLDEREYYATMRRKYLDPIYLRMQTRMATAVAASEALWSINEVVEELIGYPDGGVPVAEIERQMKRIDGYHRDRLVRTFRAALGVNILPFLSEPLIAQQMREIIAENVSLIQTIPGRFHDGVRDDLLGLIQTRPFDQQALREVMKKNYRTSKYNLRRITRDQTSKSIAKLTEVRHAQLGVERYQWVTSQDERVRPTHVANSGRMFDWSDPPPETGHPGTEVMCFTGSARIAPLGLHRSISYRYVGEVVEVALADGINITMTPNHPVLTKTGWKPAGIIDETDELFHHCVENNFISSFGNPQVSEAYPRAEDIHRFSGGVTNPNWSSPRIVDLHGNPGGRDEKIEIVDIPSILRDNLESKFCKVFADFGLKLPDLCRIAFLLPTLGGSDLASPGSTGFAGHFIGALRQISLFLGGQFGHSDITGFRSASGLESQFAHAKVDGGSWNAEIFRHLEHRIAALISGLYGGMQEPAFGGVGGVERLIFDSHVGQAQIDGLVPDPKRSADGFGSHPRGYECPDIVVPEALPFFKMRRPNAVSSRHYDGPVYSFESESGILISNGIITHNCRCVSIPIMTKATATRLQGAGAHSITDINISG